MKLRRSIVAVSVTLACAAGPVRAYSVTSYEALGASRVEACATAKKDAESATDEQAHGRLESVGTCQCSHESDPKASGQWRCLVEAIRSK
ncbi:hypothetical protein AB4Y40_07080 [Paraburkholderia sp. EG287B]|uniref:hypothetical protein n=1 Tax=Paraburkholderia sp. EG287B TaxID=3237010 RepID=UPI0034D1B7FF